MAQRCYMSLSTLAAVTPIASGVWGNTAAARNRFLAQKKTSILRPTSTAGSVVSWTAADDGLDVYLVSGPIKGDQNLGGGGKTIKCYRYVQQETAGTHARDRMEAYVVSHDGTTLRGTLLTLGGYGTQADFVTSNTTTYRNKSFALSGTATSLVRGKNGDRIVVGLGFSDASGTTPQARGLFSIVGANNDAAENETELLPTNNPWLEFSDSITWAQPWCTKVTGIKNGVSGVQSLTTGSFTPTTNSLGLIVVTTEPSTANNTSPIPTMSTTITGLAFTQVSTQTVSINGGGATFGRQTVFRYLSTSALSAGTITATIGTQNQAVIDIEWFEFENVPTTGTNGADAIVSTKTKLGGADGAGHITFTFNAPASTDNALFVTTHQYNTFPSSDRFDAAWFDLGVASATSMGVAWAPNGTALTTTITETATTTNDTTILGIEIASNYVPSVASAGPFVDFRVMGGRANQRSGATPDFRLPHFRRSRGLYVPEEPRIVAVPELPWLKRAA